MKQPKIIGLTGGIGSGKSTVAKVFLALGVPVFNSDDVAKDIVNSNKEVVNQVKKEFGDVYVDGALDKAKMATIVFNNKEALEKLNRIIHPRVGEEFEQWILANREQPLLIKEAAILIESGAYKGMDEIILVTAPEWLRVKRVMTRDDVMEQKVKARINAQLSDKAKEEYSTFLIENDDQHLIIPQVLDVYKQLKDPY